MLDRLRHSEFVTFPLLTDPALRQQLIGFCKECKRVSSVNVDANALQAEIGKVSRYGQHVQKCLDAYLNGMPLPASPPKR